MFDFIFADIPANYTNTTTVDFLKIYMYSLPSRAAQGDVAAIALSFILFFIGVFLMNKMTEAILSIIKRTILFFITGIAFLYFFKTFLVRVSVMGLTAENIIFGVFGIILGIAGTSLSFYWLFQSFKKNEIKEGKILPTKEDLEKESLKETIIPEKQGNTFETIKTEILFKEKSILAILIYLIIAEFGIFSSPTKTAPNFQIGLTFFLMFIAASVFFISKIYKNFRIGLIHFGIALIFGYILSVFLGYFWNGQSLSELVSLGYFSSQSMVALITGIAVSLFMTSR
ncbi:MAG: hypothetical protein QXM68_01290 [Candidatus Aenigmatarchaeota archaeon]|nr:hypothetical protein [Candidatus Aenigmarchaeota archaeon]